MTLLSTAPILRVRNLVTAFFTDRGVLPVVRDISLEVFPGRTLGLVGESGCGKSMTALSIIRLLPPAARILTGSVELDGLDLVTADDQVVRRTRGRKIGIVFQDSMSSLNPLLTVEQQISESLRLHLGLEGATLRNKAVELLDEVGVPDPRRRLRQYPHQLSGGLRQRVAIAIALAPDPALLIADEPTTALDVTLQAQLLELLRREQRDRNMGLLFITHDLGVVAAICDSLCVMYAGAIVEEGPVDSVFADPRHPYTLGLLDSVPRIDRDVAQRLRSIPGSPPDPAELPSGCTFRPRCSFALDRCESDVPVLVEVATRDHRKACWSAAVSISR